MYVYLDVLYLYILSGDMPFTFPAYYVKYLLLSLMWAEPYSFFLGFKGCSFILDIEKQTSPR